jgi:hypothetical protein
MSDEYFELGAWYLVLGTEYPHLFLSLAFKVQSSKVKVLITHDSSLITLPQ